jgi:hypothetical protein
MVLLAKCSDQMTADEAIAACNGDIHDQTAC